MLHDIDSVFSGLWVWWMFPVTSKVLMYSPFRGVRNFLMAPTRFKKVSVRFFQTSLELEGEATSAQGHSA
jgi:hypothetical protein